MSSDKNEVKLTTETVTKNFAEVIVNGESKGKREINGGPSVLHLAKELAHEYGVRSFNVTFTPPDGPSTPITSEAHGNATKVTAGSTVAVQAKDSRGFSKQKMNEEAPAQPAEQASSEAPSTMTEPTGNATEATIEAAPADGNKAKDEKIAEPETPTT